jgi:hypothetical protein
MAGQVTAIHAVMPQQFLPTLSIGHGEFFSNLRPCGAPNRVDGRDQPGHDELPRICPDTLP